jgi:energy-coupling factor transporter transmembrane protein EcfT
MPQILNIAKLNPITALWLFGGLAISVLLSSTLNAWLIYTIILIVLIFISSAELRSVFDHLKPYLIFLPVMSVLYVFFSILLTEMSIPEILKSAGGALWKLSLLVVIMSLYLTTSKPSDLLLAFRSVWTRSQFSPKFIEDFILYLNLVLRFYPMVQQEWKYINRSRIALKLTSKVSKWENLKQMTRNFPGLLINVYKKSENIAEVMVMRGYGQQIPRGVTFPITFKTINLIAILFISVTLYLINHYATL